MRVGPPFTTTLGASMKSVLNETLAINWQPSLADAYYGLRLGFWGTPARALRTLILVFVLPIALCGWLINLIMGPQLSLAATLGIAVAGGLAWGLLFALVFGAWLARFIVKTQRAKGDPQKILIGQEAVERILNDSKITHPWTAISHIEETQLAFLLFGSSGPIAA